jgi:hypothetical protein
MVESFNLIHYVLAVALLFKFYVDYRSQSLVNFVVTSAIILNC